MYPSSRHMTLNICLVIYVIVRIKVSVSGLQGHERSGLVVKILNKCILSILVYILFLDRQRNILYTPQYVYTPVNQMLRFVGDQRFIKRVKRF